MGLLQDAMYGAGIAAGKQAEERRKVRAQNRASRNRMGEMTFAEQLRQASPGAKAAVASSRERTRGMKQANDATARAGQPTRSFDQAKGAATTEALGGQTPDQYRQSATNAAMADPGAGARSAAEARDFQGEMRDEQREQWDRERVKRGDKEEALKAYRAWVQTDPGKNASIEEREEWIRAGERDPYNLMKSNSPDWAQKASEVTSARAGVERRISADIKRLHGELTVKDIDGLLVPAENAAEIQAKIDELESQLTTMSRPEKAGGAGDAISRAKGANSIAAKTAVPQRDVGPATLPETPMNLGAETAREEVMAAHRPAPTTTSPRILPDTGGMPLGMSGAAANTGTPAQDAGPEHLLQGQKALAKPIPPGATPEQPTEPEATPPGATPSEQLTPQEKMLADSKGLSENEIADILAVAQKKGISFEDALMLVEGTSPSVPPGEQDINANVEEMEEEQIGRMGQADVNFPSPPSQTLR